MHKTTLYIERLAQIFTEHNYISTFAQYNKTPFWLDVCKIVHTYIQLDLLTSIHLFSKTCTQLPLCIYSYICIRLKLCRVRPVESYTCIHLDLHSSKLLYTQTLTKVDLSIVIHAYSENCIHLNFCTLIPTYCLYLYTVILVNK